MPVNNPVLKAALDSISVAAIKTVMTELMKNLNDKEQTKLAELLEDAVDEADGSDPIRHATILAHVFMGMKTNADIEKFGLPIGTWKPDNCNKEIAAVLTAYSDRTRNASKKPAIFLSSSFYRYGNQEEQKVAGLSIPSAQQMIGAAVVAVKSLASNPTEDAKKTYEKYFGTYEEGRYKKVRKNLEAILKALDTRPILLYYRGESLPDTKPMPIEDSPIAEAFSEKDESIAYTYTEDKMRQPKYKAFKSVEKCAKYIHIFVGIESFTTGNAKNSKDKIAVSGVASIASTILHELSHFVCGTLDEEDPVCSGSNGTKCYGKKNVKALAAANPDKACNNADTYACYCETFHNK